MKRWKMSQRRSSNPKTRGNFSMIPNILWTSVGAIFPLEGMCCSPVRSRKLTWISGWKMRPWTIVTRASLLCSESSLNAVITNLMLWTSMCFLWEVTTASSILRKSGSKLEKNRRLRSKLLLKFPLSRKITSLKESLKSNCKVLSRSASRSPPNAKFPKLSASKTYTKPMKESTW